MPDNTEESNFIMHPSVARCLITTLSMLNLKSFRKMLANRRSPVAKKGRRAANPTCPVPRLPSTPINRGQHQAISLSRWREQLALYLQVPPDLYSSSHQLSTTPHIHRSTTCTMYQLFQITVSQTSHHTNVSSEATVSEISQCPIAPKRALRRMRLMETNLLDTLVDQV